MRPDKETVLLDIPWIIFHLFAQLLCLIFGNMFTCSFKVVDYVWQPVFFGYSLQLHHLTELIKRTSGVIEDFLHHVHLTSIQTIGRMVLQLPFWTQHWLQSFPMRNISQLLKLVNTYYNTDSLLNSYFLWKLKNRFWIFFHRVYLQIHLNRVHRITRNRYARCQTVHEPQEITPFLLQGWWYPWDNSRCEFIVKLFLCMYFVSIQETNFDLLFLFHKFFHGFFH